MCATLRVLMLVVCTLHGTLAEPIDMGRPKISDLDGQHLSNIIQTIGRTITGIDYVQGKLIGLERYREEEFHGQSLIKEYANMLGKKFKARIKAVENLRDVIQSEYVNFTDKMADDDVMCCDIDEQKLEEVPKFSKRVDLNAQCVYISPTSRPRPKYPTRKVLEAMIDNHKTRPYLKWQYFAAEDGGYFNFPANNLGKEICKTYDHRFRPFYVEAATPNGKDIVIVVDESTSMTYKFNAVDALIEMAVQTAQTILDTLNPKDRVGVITFSTETRTPPGDVDNCYSSSLAEAIPKNIEYLKDWIHKHQSNGGTRYVPAIRKAFQMLESPSPDKEKRDKVILFLTDGEPEENEEQILSTISAHNGNLNNSVIIMTYLLGTGEDQKAVRILEKMASQEVSDPTFGPITNGTFKVVKLPSRLRTEMGTFYKFFSERHRSRQPVITIPYVDAFSKDLITSILLPIYHNDVFIGVVGTDINMIDIVEDVTYFRKGETSYAFLIDGKGRLMVHPLLPKPFKVEEPPVFVHASDLEYRAAAAGVIASMIRGESGTVSIDATHVLSRGSREEGVNPFKIYTHYYWHKIQGSNCSLCIVLSDKDKRAILKASNLGVSRNFLYHDFRAQSLNGTCRYFDGFTRNDASGVKFSPFAFHRPLQYIFGAETADDIKNYESYFKGSLKENPGFKRGVRESVVATADAEYFWLQPPFSNDSRAVVRQKYGTFEGVLRMFPVKTLRKTYDFTQKPWFQRTVGNRLLYVVTTPHQDEWGAGNIITISKTIFHGIPDIESHAHDDRVAGVMATDFTVQFFYKKMMESNIACKLSGFRCFVMDSSGFLVMHERLVNDDVRREKLTRRHIVEEFPQMGQVLIDDRVLRRWGCIDYENIRVYHTWRASLGKHKRHKMTDENGKMAFILDTVPDTNLFIGVYNTSFNFFGRVAMKCPCSARGEMMECTPDCNCPCYESAKKLYNFCENRFNPSSDSLTTCSPRWADGEDGTAAMSNQHTGQLEPMHPLVSATALCVDNQCHSKTERRECNYFTGCKWCEVENSTDPSCQYFNETCQPPKIKDSDSLPVLAIALAAGGAVVGVILIVSVAVVCVRSRRRRSRDPNRTQRPLPTPRELLRSESKSTSATEASDRMARVYTTRVAESLSNHSSSCDCGSSSLQNLQRYLNEHAVYLPVSRANSDAGIDNPAWVSGFSRQPSQEPGGEDTRLKVPIAVIPVDDQPTTSPRPSEYGSIYYQIEV